MVIYLLTQYVIGPNERLFVSVQLTGVIRNTRPIHSSASVTNCHDINSAFHYSMFMLQFNLG